MEKEKKNIVLFAAIGAGLQVVTALFWLMVNLVGAESLVSFIPTMQIVTQIFTIVFCAGLLSFFIALYRRQK